ncbi:ATP synthase subunit I [Methyloligella sp. 2.7D]|uniref:N-ATPase subunit AtpR n=1 Tax=unclassified Methyloligella TaxID=2625955 RepID=UPI00157DDAC3|nr:ATP synthase subunit I [Methyloligella sp. GL2]QKP78128.1 hypothetical protein HT051_12145 [Methyloligella sp. GL2]
MQLALHIALFAAIGMALGAGFFALLHKEVGQFADGTPSGKLVALHLVRLVGAAGLFWIIAQYGAAALLASLAGFTLVLFSLKPLTSS